MAATARLTSIIFDQPTTDYLCGEIVAAQHEEEAFGMIDMYADLEEDAYKLKGLPKGSYTLIVGADLEHGDTTAKLTLINGETRDIVHEATVDLSPIMQTALLYRDDFTEAMDKAIDPDATEEEMQAADEKVNVISLQRVGPIETVLAPYIEGNQAFQLELLEVLDMLTNYYLVENMLDLTEEPLVHPATSQPGMILPGNKILH